MKTLHRMGTALALLVTAACTEAVPTQPVRPAMTEARFAELRQSALRIAERIEASGEVTAQDRLEIEAITQELDACVEVTRTPVGGELLTETATADAPLSGAPTPGCRPCPFIISNGGCIGVLRSEGPCRPGAGLERCFYNWYCYSYTA